LALSPTPEQARFIDEQSHCVAVAGPGSGKTGTLAWKITRILKSLPDYKGVIAISYTNKASHELERRCLSAGADRRNSFFGTIDKFYLAEIVMPFGRHVFGEPQQELKVIGSEETADVREIADLVQIAIQPVSRESTRAMARLYLKGIVVLETVPYLAVHTFDHSLACQRYLKARYTHIVTDEYQDCGYWQHTLFLKLVELGLIGVAVGDINQSIFAFAGKDARYLASLAQDNRFTTYPLSENHRCHLSIVNYSTRLLSPKYQPEPCDEVRVFVKRVQGDEIQMANWLARAIPLYATQFGVEKWSRIGILIKSKRSGLLVHNAIGIRHRFLQPAPLDEDSSMWAAVFRKVLYWLFCPDITKYELVEEYLNVNTQQNAVRKVMRLLSEIEEQFQTEPATLVSSKDRIVAIARHVLPAGVNSQAVEHLAETLSSASHVESYMPAHDDEVQLLTLHKSKGLEFNLVFHLDLYRWILPQYQGNYAQDSNLHYVGITRAKQACVLCTSTHRHNSNDQTVVAEDSEFLGLDGLPELRGESPF